MRILIKGGVWKNTEDEILKAAVMKYGKNQWARISSLLTRKTPKQCKARWFEWLDPSIKKTEWAKEEDEKLLHLAKLMPTQWRTIAPIVGRTPSQCLERYQWLLEEAETKEGEDMDAPTADDIRRLRPGEIDPEPESKPARPDPVDMDEDEKEMLSEARARLANTQGKKAKRKAREKQLEEARRLASLQKRRELKAAGIEMGVNARKKKRRGMDYNADIPFHKRAPVGFFDVSEEKEREVHESKKNQNIGELLSKLDGKRRSEIEEEERKKDVKKLKLAKDKGNYVPPKALRDATEEAANYLTSARRSLVLPAPQVGDAEIEELVKLKTREDEARSVIDHGDQSATGILLGDSGTATLGQLNEANIARTPLRTPATPVTDSLKVQARNLRAMEQMQTPLLGGTVELEGEDAYTYSGATPRSVSIHTPNPLTSQLTPRKGENNKVEASPVVPRDDIGINTPSRSEGGFDDTPRHSQYDSRESVSNLFKKLPKPQNDFKIVIPKAKQSMENGHDNELVAAVQTEDMEDVVARSTKNLIEEEKARSLLRSTAVQKGLPRPIIYIPEAFESSSDEATELVMREMERLLVHDMAYFPGPGQIPIPKSLVLSMATNPDVTLSELQAAHALIAAELDHCRNGMEFDIDSLHSRISNEYVFLESLDAPAGRVSGTFEQLKNSSSDRRLANYSRQLELARETVKKDHLKAQKLEKRLGVTLGGYIARSTKLKRDLAEAAKDLEDGTIALESFLVVKDKEELAATERLEDLKREVTLLEVRERNLQEKYQTLARIRDDLLARKLS
ncbi:CDC5 cell division cycle 5-like protein [Entophlyctis sp. JEL0112]|nr:CDC5 cell division cycle 5-like protein [Entophlyctis sp. JEL0112]